MLPVRSQPAAGLIERRGGRGQTLPSPCCPGSSSRCGLSQFCVHRVAVQVAGVQGSRISQHVSCASEHGETHPLIRPVGLPGYITGFGTLAPA